jgi:MFS family permease
MSRLRALFRPEDLIPRNRNERIVASSYLVNTVGNGFLVTVSAIYFTRVVGLSATELGLGFSIAAGFGLASGLFVGRWADTQDVRSLTVWFMSIAGIFDILLAFAHSFIAFAFINIAISLFDRASNTTRAVLLSRVGGPEGRVRIRAYGRSIVNLGMSVGTLLAGFVLAIDNADLYRAVIIFNGITSVLSALCLLWLPRFAPFPEAKDHRKSTALRDRSFVMLTMANSISVFHYHVVDIALPLWIVFHTSAPVWVLSVLMVMNTVAVVIFQVRFAAGAENLESAARLGRKAGFWLFAGVASYSLSTYFDSPIAATVVLMIASVLHVVGELNQAAAAFGIAYGTAPEALQGQYQAVWGLGTGLGGLMAPIALTTLCLGWGVPGWFVLGGLLFLAGYVLPIIVKAREATHG